MFWKLCICLFRARNNILNESFKSALDRTKSADNSHHKAKDNAEEKKKKGFLNSIGIFLKYEFQLLL